MAFNTRFSSRALKRGAVAAGAALVLAGGAVGVVGAQQATQTPRATVTPGAGAQQGRPGQRAQEAQPRFDQFLSTLASKLGISVDTLKQALSDTQKELGWPDRPFGPFGGPHRGPGGPGPLRAGLLHGMDTAAQAIGITPEQLRQELPGKSLSDVARAHNVDPAKVATALKNEASAKIDQAVSNGRLTAEQATQLKRRESQMVDELMTRTMPTQDELRQRGGPGGPGAPGGRGLPGRPGQPGGPGAQGQPPTTPRGSA